MTARKYDLIAYPCDRSGVVTGAGTKLNGAPLTQDEAYTMRSKYTQHPWRTIRLKEITK